MDLTTLTEDEQLAVVRQVAHDAAFQSYMAEIGAAVGVIKEAEAKDRAKLAKKAAATAKKRGVEGPYLTDAERFTIHRNNLRALEQSWLAATTRVEAGIESKEDPDALAEQHEKLLAITPPEPKGGVGVDTGHPGAPGPRVHPGALA